MGLSALASIPLGFYGISERLCRQLGYFTPGTKRRPAGALKSLDRHEWSESSTAVIIGSAKPAESRRSARVPTTRECARPAFFAVEGLDNGRHWV